MRLSIVGAALVAMLLAGMTEQQPTPQAALQLAQWGPTSGTFVGPPAGRDPPPSLIPVPEVPPVLPPIEGSPPTRQPYLYRPGPTVPSGQFSQPLNPGPVTGYGPGGLAQPPGAPSNPPFHFVP